MHPPSTHPPSTSPAPHACRILVVDDETDIRTVVAELLDAEGYPVSTATNGAEALQQVETVTPDLVLLDMRMPILDGWGFMDALHQRATQPCVLVMTAAQSARQWAQEVGADGFVAKPFDLDTMLHAVERVCAARDNEDTRSTP